MLSKNTKKSNAYYMLPDHASPECHVGRYRFTSLIPIAREENFSTSLRECTESLDRVEQHTRNFVPLARPKWRNPPIIHNERWSIPNHVDYSTRAVKQVKMSVPLPFRQYFT